MENEEKLKKHYSIIKNDYSKLFKIFIQLEEEKKEHLLVISTIENLEKDRKCWRMIGGALVERTVGEVLPALQERMKNELDVKLKEIGDKMDQKAKELGNIEKQLGITNNDKDNNQNQISNENDKKAGILA